MLKKITNNNKFDFDIGHLTKSPCRECDLQNHLPNCSENCQKLDRIQTLLIVSISCSNAFHHTEPYAISKRNN